MPTIAAEVTFGDLEAVRQIEQKRAGRPSIISEEIATNIIKHVCAGNYLGPSCAAAGVAYSAVRNWIRRGKLELQQGLETPYTRFVETLSRAVGGAETELVRRIGVHDDWRAQAFILERRHRVRWGKSEEGGQRTQVLVVSSELAESMLSALRVAAARSIGSSTPQAVVANEGRSLIPDVMSTSGDPTSCGPDDLGAELGEQDPGSESELE